MVEQIQQIYFLSRNSGEYEALEFEEENIPLSKEIISEYKLFSTFDIFHKQVSLKSILKPLKIKARPYDYERKGRRKSRPDYSNCFADFFSKESINGLSSLFGNKFELLPLLSPYNDKDYFILNILETIDALDLKNSIYETNIAGYLKNIKKYEFKPELINENHIFKIHRHDISTFVSDIFVERVLENKLKGFLFKPVWSSETGGIEYPEYSEIAGVDRTQNWIRT